MMDVIIAIGVFYVVVKLRCVLKDGLPKRPLALKMLFNPYGFSRINICFNSPSSHSLIRAGVST